MQPQDSNNPTAQQPNLGAPAGSTPPATPPATSPAPSGTWQPGAPAPASGGNKKKMMLVVGVVVGLAVVAAIIFGAMKFFGGKSIKLETFSNENFSLLVPVGYKKEEGAVIAFQEPGDKDTQSAVLAQYEKMPETIEESQLAEVRKLFKEQIQQSAPSFVNSDEELKDLKVEDTTFKGQEGILITASIAKGGKVVGDLKMVAVINTEAIYIVGVGVHNSDKDLHKKVDTIINSFELKK